MPLEIYKQYLNVTSRLTIGQGALSVIVQNLTGEDTRIVWEVTKTSTPNSDTASVKVYNLSKSQRKILQQIATLKGFGFKATLEIGYDGVLSKLMTGSIWKTRPEVWEGNVDIVSEIEFGDGLVEQRDANPFAVSLEEGFWVAAIEAIAAQMGLIVSSQFKAALATAPIALAYPIFSVALGGNPKEDLNKIVSSLGPGYSWTVQDGQILMLVRGYLENFSPPQILSPATGLLTYVVRDDGGIDATALAHPSVVPGGGVIFHNVFGIPQAAGLCRVETVSFSGDGYADSTMDILARPLI